VPARRPRTAAAAEPNLHDPNLHDAVRGVAFAARTIERSLGSMTLAQLRILTLVARDPIRARALADGAALSRPTLTGLLEGLVAKGWVERCAVDGDRRGVTLSITESGRVALAEAERESAAALTGLLDELPADERDAAARSLAALSGVAHQRLARKAAAAALESGA
jgi:DNA-binding MarR family transcriptional regulator